MRFGDFGEFFCIMADVIIKVSAKSAGVVVGYNTFGENAAISKN